MSKEYSNKMMKTGTVEATAPFFFPEHGITVEAVNQEDALKKLEAIINKNNQ